MKSAQRSKRMAAWLLCILLALLCAGQALAEEVMERTPGEATCDHSRHDAVETWDENVRYLSNDDGFTHTKMVDIYGRLKCLNCGEIINEHALIEANVSRGAENHRYSGSERVCMDCGHVCQHVYENGMCKYCGIPCMHPDYSEEREEYRPVEAWHASGDGENHIRVADRYVVWTCGQCGVTGEVKLEGQITQSEAHSYGEGGVCTVCGAQTAACTHPRPESHFFNRDVRSFEYIGNGRHSFICDVYLGYNCPDCGAYWYDQEPVEVGMQSTGRCYYNDEGVCVNCGFAAGACQHPQMVEYKDIDFDTIQVISIDSQHHVYTADVIAYDYCPDCRERFNERVVDTGVQFRETHDRWFMWTQNGSVCELCGYEQTCAHEHVETEIYPSNIKKVLSADARTHTLLCNGYEEKRCVDCGYLFSSNAVLNVELTDMHYYDAEGVCRDCGYKTECTHENRQTFEWYDTVHSIQIVDSASHSFIGDKWECWECLDCGFVGEEKKVADNAYFVEEHFYEDGDACVVCGMAKPDATPEPTATPVPTPAPTPEPEDVFVPTPRPAVKRTAAPTAAPTLAPTAVPEKKEIVSTLFEAVAEAQAEGKNVEVEIVGAQEVMTQEEYTELKALTVQEQVLVTLKSVGLDEVVQAAMTAMRVNVSNEAQGLMDKVSARMDTMTTEEKTAYEDKLAEYFPMTERVVGGVTVRTFTIDMKVVVNGFERVERYQFYLNENGEWVFEKVDLASFGKV